MEHSLSLLKVLFLLSHSSIALKILNTHNLSPMLSKCIHGMHSLGDPQLALAFVRHQTQSMCHAILVAICCSSSASFSSSSSSVPSKTYLKDIFSLRNAALRCFGPCLGWVHSTIEVFHTLFEKMSASQYGEMGKSGFELHFHHLLLILLITLNHKMWIIHHAYLWRWFLCFLWCILCVCVCVLCYVRKRGMNRKWNRN